MQLDVNELWNFSRRATFKTPFPHFVIPEFIHPTFANALLDWLERDASWVPHVEPNFYALSECDLERVALPDHLSSLRSANSLKHLARQASDLFGVELHHGGIKAHRLIAGDKIGIHNDYALTKYTHRLIVQLNRGWSVANGGFLMLLDQKEPAEVTELSEFYLPSHRSAISFAFTPSSFHAVTQVNRGERFTVCFSFTQEAREDGAEGDGGDADNS